MSGRARFSPRCWSGATGGSRSTRRQRRRWRARSGAPPTPSWRPADCRNSTSWSCGRGSRRWRSMLPRLPRRRPGCLRSLTAQPTGGIFHEIGGLVAPAVSPADSTKPIRLGGTAICTVCPRRCSPRPIVAQGSTSPRVPWTAKTNFIVVLLPMARRFRSQRPRQTQVSPHPGCGRRRQRKAEHPTS